MLKELEALPWHDPNNYPWTKVLEEHCQEIKAEFEGLIKDSQPMDTIKSNVASGEWKTFYLYNQVSL
jgi:hypothetical protein